MRQRRTWLRAFAPRGELAAVLVGACAGALILVAAVLILLLGVDSHQGARVSVLDLTVAAAGVTLVILVLAALAAHLTRTVLIPVRRVAQAAVLLGEGRSGGSVPESGRGEVAALGRAFNGMSRMLEERERRLRTTEERFQGILDNANAAIYIKDAAGRYLLVNREFERIRRLRAEDVLGHTEHEIAAPEIAEQIRETDRAVIEGRVPMSFEQEMPTPDGVRTYLAVKFPVHGRDGAVSAIAGISTDITDQKNALAQAVDTSRLRSEFVANISHEIRTPLSGVIGMAGLLRKTSLDAVQRGYVDALAASSEALLAVINDILDFSKIEAGHIELDPTDFDLRHLVDEVCSMSAGQARDGGVEFTHSVDAALPATVTGDRGRLRQILLNLFSNALKFTDDGEVTVRVSPEREGVVRFEVADTGVGIEAGQAAELFEPFVQADQSMTRRMGGTGLGLTISRELVRSMSGEIGAVPRKEGGSVFWFTAALPEGTTVEETVRSGSELCGLRALIVDSFATNRTIFGYYLKTWGLSSECVDRPGEAIEALEAASRSGEPFGLLLLDLDMPRESGIQLARAIRARPALRALQIVVVSSAAVEQELLADAGISTVLRKPIRRSQLFNAIVDAVERPAPFYDGQSTGDQSRDPGWNDLAASACVGADGPVVLIAEDNAINVAVARALLTGQGLGVSVAHDGTEAVGMALANDYAAILMDCQMPGLDGYEATSCIRAAGTRRVPVIAMTAHAMPGDRERCLAAGMDDYLSKPVQAEQLEAMMNRWLPTDRPKILALTRPEGVSSASALDSSGVGQVLDEAIVRQLRRTQSPAMLEDLCRAFDGSLDKSVADILSAVERRDNVELRRVSHMLKGTSATLGAARLSAACQRMEEDTDAQALSVTVDELDELQVASAEVRQALAQELLDR